LPSVSARRMFETMNWLPDSQGALVPTVHGYEAQGFPGPLRCSKLLCKGAESRKEIEFSQDNYLALRLHLCQPQLHYLGTRRDFTCI
jgi:hypothetical protein